MKPQKSWKDFGVCGNSLLQFISISESCMLLRETSDVRRLLVIIPCISAAVDTYIFGGLYNGHIASPEYILMPNEVFCTGNVMQIVISSKRSVICLFEM